MDEPTLRAVYTSSDLVIAPALNPSGIVALEAAAMGVPLVVGDTGGLAEFVTDQRGRRCRPNDAADLAAQIVTTFDEPRANNTSPRRHPILALESVHLERGGSPHGGGGVRQGATAPASARVTRAPANRSGE